MAAGPSPITQARSPKTARKVLAPYNDYSLKARMDKNNEKNSQYFFHKIPHFQFTQPFCFGSSLCPAKSHHKKLPNFAKFAINSSSGRPTKQHSVCS